MGPTTPQPELARPERYLTNEEAATFLRLSPRTLEKQRVLGGGPRFRKFGRRVMYSLTDLEAWADSRAFEMTSDPGLRRTSMNSVKSTRSFENDMHGTALALTRVTLVYLPGRVNIWLRFGHSLREWHLDPVRRQLDFPAEALLGRVHWEGNEYGTTRWRMQVLRTVCIGEPVRRMTGVEPGAEVLLDVGGESKVDRALTLIDVIEAQRVDPADVSPAYWCTVHNRFMTRQEPPLYDGRTHAAFLGRRRFHS